MSSDEQYLAALVDESFVGLFPLRDIVAPRIITNAGRDSGEYHEILKQVAPIFRIPINVPTCSSGKLITHSSRNDIRGDTINRVERKNSGAADGVTPDRIITDKVTRDRAGRDRVVRDLTWSPSHVGGGMLLVVAGSSCVCVWEVPNIDKNDISKNKSKSFESSKNCGGNDDKITAPAPRSVSLAPQLLYSFDLCASATAPTISTTSGMPSPFSIRRIEWHTCALPTLVAFSLTSNPVRIELPRRAKDTTVVDLFENQPQCNSKAKVKGEGEVKVKVKVHPYGAVSVSGKQVYAVDVAGCVTVLLDPLNDPQARITSASSSSSSSMLGVGSSREVKAMCVSGDDSVVCVSYSIPTALSPTSLLSSSSSLLSLKSLQSVVGSRPNGGFTHVLAGASLHDALFVPHDRTASAPAQTSKNQRISSDLLSALSITADSDRNTKSRESLSLALKEPLNQALGLPRLSAEAEQTDVNEISWRNEISEGNESSGRNEISGRESNGRSRVDSALDVVSASGPRSMGALESLMSVGTSMNSAGGGMKQESGRSDQNIRWSAGRGVEGQGTGGGGGMGGVRVSRIVELVGSSTPSTLISKSISSLVAKTSSEIVLGDASKGQENVLRGQEEASGGQEATFKGPVVAVCGEVEILWLRHTNADTPPHRSSEGSSGGSTGSDVDASRGGSSGSSDEGGSSAGRVTSGLELTRALSVPLHDPHMARPDLVACHIFCIPSIYSSSSSLSSLLSSSSLNGCLAVASSQSGRILLFSLLIAPDSAPGGCTARPHSQHTLPANQVY